jgi:tRNA-specific adenosine deaminase 1
MHPDDVAKACLLRWSTLESQGRFKFLEKGVNNTILAGIVLSHYTHTGVPGSTLRTGSNESESESELELELALECISLGAGSKCLPQVRLASLNGGVLHDSHAEVLARRSAMVWLAEEILTMSEDPDCSAGSRWLVKSDSPGRYTLRAGVRVHLYVSALPCTFSIH